MKMAKLFSKIGDKLGADLQLHGFEGFEMTMDSGGRLCFSGNCSLQSYTDEEISVRFENKIVTVAGERLFVSALSRNTVAVSGEIGRISFLTANGVVREVRK